MKVTVEFIPSELQKPSMSDPLPIATWKLLDPISEFPFKARITERHCVGRSIATGIELYQDHKRDVWITSKEVGYVQPCPDDRCWDQRRFGSRLYGTNSKLEKRGWRLTLTEVLPEH